MKETKIITSEGIRSGIPQGYMKPGESAVDATTGHTTYVSKQDAKSVYASGKNKDDVPVGGYNFDNVFIPAHSTGLDKALAPMLKKADKITKAINKIKENPQLSSLSSNTAKVMEQQLKMFHDQNIKPFEDIQAARDGALTANCGKSPKYAVGKGAYISAIPSMAAAIAQESYFRRQRPRYHDIYAENPNAFALNRLAALRFDPNPQVKAIQDAERRAAYANMNSSGPSGLKHATRVALGIGAMQNAANVYANAQLQNNQLAAQYAQAALAAGEQNASRRQAANQYGVTDYSTQQKAYNSNLWKSIQNIPYIIGQAYKNYNTDLLNRQTLDIYKQDLDARQKAIAAEIASRNADRELLRLQMTPDIQNYIAAYNQNNARAYRKRNDGV